MVSASEKDSVFWSLASWAGGIVAFLVVYAIVRGAFGGSVPDALVFASVAFMLVAGILTFRLGPRDAPAHPTPVQHAHTVPHSTASGHQHGSHQHDSHQNDAPVSIAHETGAHEPIVHAREADQTTRSTPSQAATDPAPAAPAAADAPAADLTGARSERVSEAAREAARLAVGLEGPASAPKRPARLEAPREGGPDNLRKIKGIGPKIEDLLHKLGYYHFDQIAAWTPEEVAWADTNIEDFPGRASRDDWVGQAKVLASGGATEFSQRVDRGEVY